MEISGLASAFSFAILRHKREDANTLALSTLTTLPERLRAVSTATSMIRSTSYRA